MGPRFPLSKECQRDSRNTRYRFPETKIAIFCDGEFWHGYQWEENKPVASNASYWENKIQKNILRDKKVNQELIDAGWVVLRFWSKEIKNNLENAVCEIVTAVLDRNKP